MIAKSQSTCVDKFHARTLCSKRASWIAIAQDEDRSQIVNDAWLGVKEVNITEQWSAIKVHRCLESG